MSIERGILIASALPIVLLSACTAGAPTTSIPSPTTASPSSPPSPTAPAAPAAAFPSPGLATVGPAEVVFDWSADRCAPEDIPDLPARAFRDAQGTVHLIAAHMDGRSFNGPSLNELQRDCEVIMHSDRLADPSLSNDNEWLASTYTEDGATIYAIVHNEFHGWEHGLCTAAENFACWYNTLTLAVSGDGGRTFRDAAAPPGHMVASLPYPYEDGAGPYGVMEPASIVKKDGFYYMFVRVDEYRSESQRLCLLRTDTLGDPASWRAWDGYDFNIVMHGPYAAGSQPDAVRHCAALDADLGMVASGITFNTYLNQYVMVGISTDNFSSDREIWGVMYAFSRDLIDWDRRVLLFEAPLPWSRQDGNPRQYLYPSLLDPDSASLSFETSGKTAYLYLTRFNGGDPLDRDLLRIPVEFFPTTADAAAAMVPFEP